MLPLGLYLGYMIFVDIFFFSHFLYNIQDNNIFKVFNFCFLMDEREEIIIKGQTPFIDKRGSIYNYYLTEPINWIGLITSIGKNIMRANHYHPEQEQKVLVVSGKYISVYKDLTFPNSQIKHNLVKAGDLVITPPNVAHTMIFLENTILINLVNGERKHENYGEHTKPYELVRQEEIHFYVSKYGDIPFA